jgi:[CysO sulfur-carrier protein]-S-L-cysteine hydrolase
MIRIRQHVVDGIIKQAQDELPNEACGYLIGKNDEITQQYPLTNVDHSPDHFAFDPSEQFQVLRLARSQDLDIIANYHSHPSTPARPSQEDIRLAYDPNILYFILSLATTPPVLKAFRIRDSQVSEVSLEIY